jgi:hypothetical protein
MNQRCSNKKSKAYKDYGGRGITVCDEWRRSFEQFYNDMGEPPPGTSLERNNVNGNYEPANCSWATDLEQMRNRRCTWFVMVDGKEYYLSEIVAAAYQK